MPSLELKIPPRLVALVVALAMWVVSYLGPRFQLPQANHWATALAGTLIGGAITLAGAIALRRAKTTVNPFRPQNASVLVTQGIFGLTRNPMYVGLTLALLGWAAFLSAPWSLLGPPIFVLYIDRFQIQPEERALMRLFGAEYAKYTQQVRRWL
jgi:protein-S-isoprenylcysteine O-methyltransferase Ste14